MNQQQTGVSMKATLTIYFGMDCIYIYVALAQCLEIEKILEIYTEIR